MARATTTTELRRRTLADNVADEIIGVIISTNLRRGDRLPPVTSLAEQFDVSRSVVRDALEQLADEGTIARNGNRRWTVQRRPGARRSRAAGSSAAAGTMAHPSLADQAADAVLRLILDRGLKEGHSLPASGELAEQLGVSLIVMREALASLAARGILSRRQGRESVVALPSHALISSILRVRAALSEIEIDEFRQARAALEVEAVTTAAKLATDDDVAELRQHLHAMQDAQDVATFNEHDVAFHMTVARISRNRAIELLLASLHDIVRMQLEVFYRRVEKRAGMEGIRTALGNHERVAAAIADRDPEAAADAMVQHFNFVGPK